ncbi:hypothetical protein BDV98DRAFT_575198 [Pterulicium gracile]|uniref:Uncharacterized protein n=1 Tax=Pterulicium gracile TaxID=1884261 RepID=A0A5C3Q7G2_9AGAR|nr:hypothetical protein BDV98DRAFT_575198 [Pterula gracilis]
MHSSEHPDISILPTNTPFEACFACGIADPQFTCTSFPITQFDFSPAAYQATRHFVEKGKLKINQLRRAVDRLSAMKDDLSHLVQQQQNYLSPIHCLPNDILLLIFGQTQGSGCFADGPWDISNVCRQCRTLSVSSPTLWSKIYFDPGFDGLNPNETGELEDLRLRCNCIDLQLDRSQTCPPEVEVD